MARVQNDWHTHLLTVGDLGEQPIAFRQCEYVAHMPTAMQYQFPRRLFDKVIKVEFEGALYDAPADYDEYLKILYSDYM